MPSTRREWEKRVRASERELRDARRTRLYVGTGQLMGFVVFAAGITLAVVFASVGWVMLSFIGLAMFGIATAMAAEWTLYQDVRDAKDRVEDLTGDFEAWKLEQATATVESF